MKNGHVGARAYEKGRWMNRRFGRKRRTRRRSFIGRHGMGMIMGAIVVAGGWYIGIWEPTETGTEPGWKTSVGQPKADNRTRATRNTEHLEGVATVVDGDTIRVQGTTVRLHGMDAPEMAQPEGARAKAALERLLRGKKVQVESHGTGYYGRTIGTVHVLGRDGRRTMNANQRMVRSGQAWVNRRYSQRYVADEEAARRERNGVHRGGDAEKPWEFRNKK